MKKQKKWYDYMWIVSATYLLLGFFNILFAWLGLLCFFIPLIISAVFGNKSYCNKYCGRGQLFQKLGQDFKLSRNKSIPPFLRSKYFRYGFLAFFMFMFLNMIFYTYLVFKDIKTLKEVITLLWTFKVPFSFANHFSNMPNWVSQFSFGFYSVMLTSTILGIMTMLLYKPRSWCVYCPMGTMTQGICIIKNR